MKAKRQEVYEEECYNDVLHFHKKSIFKIQIEFGPEKRTYI